MAARTKQTSTLIDERVGACMWCKRSGQRVSRRWDELFRCVDSGGCDSARYRDLTERGVRPRSWYEELAGGRYENRREARKHGFTTTELKELVVSMGLEWNEKERKPKDGTDTNEEGNDE